MYYAYNHFSTDVAYKIIFHTVDVFQIWNDQLARPRGLVEKLLAIQMFIFFQKRGYDMCSIICVYDLSICSQDFVQSFYIQIILSNSIWRYPMVVPSLKRRKIIVCHSDWDEIIGHMVHYLCAINALIYLAKISGRILFCKDLLSSSSASPTKY